MSGDDPTQDDADAYPWLKFWLRFTSESLRAEFASLTPWRVLVFLRTLPDQEASVADIIKGVDLSTSSATRSLRALEAARYIARRPSSTDSRVENLRLTSEGRHALGKLFHAARSPQ